MKSISKFALALSAGTLALGGIAISPAALAKKEAKPAAASKQKLNYSKEFLTAYQPAQELLYKKKDLPASVASLASVKASVMNDDDRYEAGGFVFNVGSQSKDIKIQMEGLDMMLASASTPAELRPKYTYFRGAFAYDMKDYAGAETFMNQAIALGYAENDVLYLIANAQSQQKKYPEASASIKQAITTKAAAGKAVPSIWYAQAKSYASKQKDRSGEIYWGKELIKIDQSPEAYHDALFPFLSYTELSVPELLDVFRLARESKALLFSQEFKGYVEAADRKRSPAEVLTVIDEGVAKGVFDLADRSIADDVADAKLNKVELAKNWDSDEQYARKQSSGTQAMLFADRIYAFGEYARAATMYQVAVEKGGLINKEGANVNDQAVMRLAISKVKLNDLMGAKAELAKITDPKRKMIAEYWDIYVTQQMAKAAPAVVAG
jgi:hypothetical protein